MRKLFLFMVLIMLNSAFASCYTGFACSIESLQAVEWENSINSYFAKNVPEINYITGKLNVLNYNDLFIFNTIV